MKIFLFLSLLIFSYSVSADPFLLYVSPNGSDSNTGLSEGRSIKTLQRANDLLIQYAPSTKVNIILAPGGVYYSQSVNWTFRNGQVIKFAGNRNSRPVFDGQGINRFFDLKRSGGDYSLLYFRYIKVQNYCYGMRFLGNRNRDSGSNGGNRLYGMFFYQIGGKYANCTKSTGAIVLVNSDNNKIENSHFVKIENSQYKASIHAVYIAHLSERNRIESNRFSMISGDPIRIRDLSNYNSIISNRFYDTGAYAYYSDWHCEGSSCTKSAGECPSYGNRFKYNYLYGGYTGSIKAFKKFGDPTYCGAPPSRWLIATGNIKE